jgi:hypothetical protein
MGVQTLKCSELTRLINKLQNSYQNLTNSEIRYYTPELIRSYKARKIPLLDTKVIIRSVITKNKNHLKALNTPDIDKYIENIYKGAS